MREYFYFLKLMRRELHGVVIGIVLSFIASFSSVALMGTATWFLSAMAIAGFYDYALNIFIPSALIRLLALLRTLLRYLERYTTHDATFKLLAFLRVFLFERALDLKIEEALKLRSADLQRRMQADVDRLEMIYVRQVAPFVCAVLMGLVVGGVLLYFSYLMAFTALALMLLAGVMVPVLLTMLSFKESQAQNSLAVELNNQSANLLHGFFDLVLLGTHGHVAAEFLQRSQQLAKARSRIVFYEQISQVALLTCAELSLLLLLIEGVPLLVAGQVSPPMLMLLAVSTMASFEVLVPLAAACLNLPYVVQAAGRVSTLLQITKDNSELHVDSLQALALDLEAENTQADATNLSEQTLSERESTNLSKQSSFKVVSNSHKSQAEVIVALENVSFAYHLDESGYLNVLENCSLSFSSQRNYLLKAPSGRGKSTLVMLLTALLLPQKGQLTLNGQPYSVIERRKLRSHFAVAMQDISLFSGSIKEIFSQINAKISNAEIMELLEIVELRELVLQLPDGLETWIGSTGLSLSGGQLRRLCVARALMQKEADFLILDEPGEGLDEEQEKRIVERIQALRKGVIIITHKHAGADLSDEVIIL